MDEIKTLEQITKLEVHSCTCEGCVSMCKRCSCLGTPTDILKIIEAGYADKISRTTWMTGMSVGYPAVDMFTVRFDDDKGQCSFLENDRCILHSKGLKPMEGRLASHDEDKYKKGKFPPWLAVAHLWNNEENQPVFEKIRELMGDKEGRKDENTLVMEILATMIGL